MTAFPAQFAAIVAILVIPMLRNRGRNPVQHCRRGFGEGEGGRSNHNKDNAS